MIILRAAVIGVLSASALTTWLWRSAMMEPASAASVPFVVAQAQPTPAPDFGSPPPGEYPILFNDQHVYSRPDKLKADRLLSALVRDGTILVPLRSMFEQMGASVSYAPSSKTVSVTRPGIELDITVGKSEVVINGQSRSIDVPAEIDRGIILVPVRVISEALGAYVEWVPDRKTIVVRFVPPTPPPTPAPTETPAATPEPTPIPTPVPTAAPKKAGVEGFIAGSSIVSSKVYNELVEGANGKSAFDVKGALELPLGKYSLTVGGDFHQYRYDHRSNFGSIPCSTTGATLCTTVIGSDFNYRGGTCPSNDPGCVTVIGYPAYVKAIGLGQAYYPAAVDEDRDYDARVGIGVLPSKVYLDVSLLGRQFDYLNYPNETGIGFGLEKLPNLHQALSWYGSFNYYPTVKGRYTGPTSVLLGSLSGAAFTVEYSVYTYDLGLTYDLFRTPVFVQAGVLGDRGNAKVNAPSDFTHGGFFIGAGVRL